jgi:alginate O-acetyltransferase complex protein AlgI
MGTWFRDYVYFPLGGSRSATRARNLLNLLVVWTLTGIWHGANWTFLAWGLMYFVLIACEKLLRADRHTNGGALASIAGWAYTMFFVMVGWVFFRATSLAQGWRYFGALFGRGVECVFEPKTLLLLSENAVFLVCAVLFSMPMGRWARGTVARFRSAPPLRIAGDLLYASWIVGILVVSVSYLAKGAHNPFIYFNF